MDHKVNWRGWKLQWMEGVGVSLFGNKKLKFSLETLLRREPLGMVRVASVWFVQGPGLSRKVDQPKLLAWGVNWTPKASINGWEVIKTPEALINGWKYFFEVYLEAILVEQCVTLSQSSTWSALWRFCMCLLTGMWVSHGHFLWDRGKVWRWVGWVFGFHSEGQWAIIFNFNLKLAISTHISTRGLLKWCLNLKLELVCSVSTLSSLADLWSWVKDEVSAFFLKRGTSV